MFAKIFLVCFFSIQGLFIVGHIFTNLDEIIEITERGGGISYTIREFYWPRICLFFDQTFALLTLTAAIFAYVFLQRSNQTVAVEAGGISKSRIVRPLIGVAIILLGVSVVNREFNLPQFQSSLARTAQNWQGENEIKMQFRQDFETGVVLTGNRVIPSERTITNPSFQVNLDNSAIQIIGSKAVFENATKDRPAGYLIKDIPTEDSARLLVQDVIGINKQPVVLIHSNHSWIGKDQVFVVTSLGIDEIAHGTQMDRYASLSQLVEDSKNPSLFVSSRQRVDIHSRIVRPFLDLSVILLGLPIVISRRDRNLFIAGGTCLLVVTVLQLVVMACSGLGSMGLIRSADLAAWLPLMIFFPLSFVALNKLNS